MRWHHSRKIKPALLVLDTGDERKRAGLGNALNTSMFVGCRYTEVWLQGASIGLTYKQGG